MIVKKDYSKIVILALAVLLFFVAFASLFFGQIEIPIKNTVSIIGYQLGLPFFDKQILDMIASRVDQIRHPWVISEEDDEYVQVNAMIIGLFNRLWNEKKENQ